MRRLPFALLLTLSGAAFAQAGSTIYVCTDAKGRRITSDRPIVECLDREQKQYGTGGTVKGTLPPSMTADERAAAEDKARKEQEDLQRQAELRRRDRILISRYPTQAPHDHEREESLTRIDDAIASGDRRLLDLQKQHEDLKAQLDKPATDVVRANRLKRAFEENEANQAAQQRLLAAQRDERQRIATRFDEELARLKILWAQQAAMPVKAPASAVKAASQPKR